MKGIQERKTKDGEIRYRVQVRMKGHPPVRATFESKTKAKLWKQKTECSIRDGKYFKTSEARKHTLSDAICRYERDVLPNKPRAKQEQQMRYWKEQLGSYYLSDITPALIAEHRDKLSQSITRFGRKMFCNSIFMNKRCQSITHETALKSFGGVHLFGQKSI